MPIWSIRSLTELQALIAQARDERAALSAMLTQMAGGTSTLAQTSKSLEQVDLKSTATLARVDDLSRRLEGLEDRANAFGEVEKRVLTLIEPATQAQQVAEKIMAPDGDLPAHRRQVQQLSSQALETQASIDALKKERAALDEFRNQLRQAQTEIKQAVERIFNVKVASVNTLNRVGKATRTRFGAGKP